MLVLARHHSSALAYRLGWLLEPAMVIGDRIPRDKVPDVDSDDRKPYIGELVHYTTFGHPTGESKSCRPALVVEVLEDGELLLAVLRSNGLLYEKCRREEEVFLGGTYHDASHA